MSRIRSIHPGLFTDEAFMSLTVEAPLACPLLLGLWCEADDAGTFEWKPLTIKARILPAASPDVNQLLAALVNADVIKQFEIDGKRFGVIRNFVKFQRPKEPKVVHPSSPESLAYAGFEANGARPRSGTGRPPGTTSEPLPKSAGSPSEKGCQREDVGGRREDEDEGGKDTPSLRSGGASADAREGNRDDGEPKLPAAPKRSWRKEFAVWYLVYPKKVDRGDAERRFEHIVRNNLASLDELVRGAEIYAEHTKSWERRYVKAPGVWLNKKGWLDEYDTASFAKPQTNTSFLLNINGDFYDESDSSVPFERSSAAYVAGFGESGEGISLAPAIGGPLNLLDLKPVGSG